MKFFKIFMAISGLSVTAIPTTFSFWNNQYHKNTNNPQIEFLELDTFENLFLNIIKMVENNSFKVNQQEIHFDHWKNKTSSEIEQIFYDRIPKIYEKYFDNQMFTLRLLRSEKMQEEEIKTYEANFTNKSGSFQTWDTQGHIEKVTQESTYSVLAKEAHEFALKLTLSFVVWSADTGFKLEIGNDSSETITNKTEKTIDFKPQKVKINPYSTGLALYRITKAKAKNYGMLTAMNMPPFSLAIPTFITTSGDEINLNLTAKDLLEGLEKEGYNLRLIGNGSTKFSVISYDDTKPIQEVDTFSFNMPMEWETDMFQTYLSYKQTSLK